MAIQIDARILVTKADLQSLGVPTDTDKELADFVETWLEDRLHTAFGEIEHLKISITRKVKAADFPVIPGTNIAVNNVVHNPATS